MCVPNRQEQSAEGMEVRELSGSESSPDVWAGEKEAGTNGDVESCRPFGPCFLGGAAIPAQL